MEYVAWTYGNILKDDTLKSMEGGRILEEHLPKFDDLLAKFSLDGARERMLLLDYDPFVDDPNFWND